MKMSLYDILLVLMNLDCAKCPTYNPDVKSARIKEAIRHIQNNLIREYLPNIKDHKFKKDEKSEVMAHVGGHNNCRAMTIRQIRKFCAVEGDITPKEQKQLILID